MDLTPETIAAANAKSVLLRELIRAPGILVMPGAYDTISALVFESMGFKAIQGSSGAIAAVYGRHDGEVLGRERTVAVYRGMTEAVQVPVNADGEKGYGGPEDMAETLSQMVGAGVAGMNLEDSPRHAPGTPTTLEPLSYQLEKIGALMAAKKEVGSEFFLNARVDAFVAIAEPETAMKEAIERGNAYAEAGGDCIFFMGPLDASKIRTLVKEVAAPVSILAGANSPGVAELEDLGVARVSYGSAFGNAALAGARRLAEVVLNKGDPAALLREGFPGAELRKLLRS